MTSLGWHLTLLVSRMLDPCEREAVQGDLLEAGETGWRSLVAVLGLCVRRQAGLWRNWRPWLAAFGLAIPGSFLLMGFSLSVSRAYQQWLASDVFKATGFAIRPGFTLFVWNLILLAGIAWAGGFVVGSISRRTVWASTALSFAPCLFCLERFRIESLSRFCLLLFLPPAIWGAHRGLRIARIKLSSALALAVTLTALTIPAWSHKGSWIPNWALSWPAWYLVATSYKSRTVYR